MSIRRTTEYFINAFRKTHGDTYDYSRVKYVNCTTKVEIVCKTHGPFLQTTNSHKDGSGCPKCGDLRVAAKNGVKNAERGRALFAITQEEMLSKCIAKHGNRYSYDKVAYVNYYTPVVVTCSIHGEFSITPDMHIHGTGCASCAHTQKYSKAAVAWLMELSTQTGLVIQHACNGGEYLIPGTQIKVDGYCAKTNTVYEYHGSKWHGDPAIYLPTDRCHPFDLNVTAGQLLTKTLNRESKIKALGYNLVTVWESELHPDTKQRYLTEVTKERFN